MIVCEYVASKLDNHECVACLSVRDGTTDDNSYKKVHCGSGNLSSCLTRIVDVLCAYFQF